MFRKRYDFKKIFFLFLLLCSLIQYAKKADMVVFSYDRPMQLYALLESTEKYITGLEKIYVIYRISNTQYDQAYEKVKQKFDYVTFLQQGESPKQDFKPLTLKATFKSSSDYIIFAVDDIIVKDFLDIEKSIAILEKTNAYGFYFRLGLHLTRCYPFNCDQKVPSYKYIQDDIYSWKFKNGTGDWRYPNTVDMTLYRKKDIEKIFRTSRYNNPNTLEGTWGGQGIRNISSHPIGLCYKESKIVNLPLNRIQNIWKNRTMNAFSPKELLDLFNQNVKININALYKIQNISAHMDYVPEFIKR